MDTSRSELLTMLSEEELNGVPLLVFCNKQDIEGALRPEEISERLGLVGEKGREADAETRTLVERGGGEYEVLDVLGGMTRWKQSLSRNKRKAEAEGRRNLSIVGETDSLKLAAGDAWDVILEELKR